MAEPDSTSPGEAPRLPGIVPVGNGEVAPVAPVNPLVGLAVQFFVVPMAIVVLCVALVYIFRWLTWEKRDVPSYLTALKSGTRSPVQKQQDAVNLLNYIQEAKRWQSIYDVTEQLRFNREQFLAENPDFPRKIAQIFRESTGADRRIRQYLAQVLRLVGGAAEVPILVSALDDPDSETVIHSMMALGQIGDRSAVPALIQASQSRDRGIRQTAVFVLGAFDDPSAVARCAEALHDPDLLVGWNAAFGLARGGDPRAIPTLEQLLDMEYVERVTHDYTPTTGDGGAPTRTGTTGIFQPERLEQYRVTAVRLLARYPEERIRKELQKTAENDKQLKVRQAAIEALQKGGGGVGKGKEG